MSLFVLEEEREGAIWHASDLLLEGAHKKGRNEWYESKPCLFILHNQLNIIIGPFKSARIKDQ